MPWKEVTVIDEKQKFIALYLENEYPFSHICRQFKISRKTGYELVKRYREHGIEGLANRSKAPYHQHRAVSESIIKLILTLKLIKNAWGPKKIHGHIKRFYPDVKCPCRTTIENILKRHCLVEPRKLRRRFALKTAPLAECRKPNDVWCVDFKGYSITADGHKCGPLTIMDADTRFIIACVRLKENNMEHVWEVFEISFKEQGLPLRVRSDNGPPFASAGPGRLSKLSINLIKAGVVPEWIEPGHPEQNGRHERMHLTLKKEGILNDLDLNQQIIKLGEFQSDYNFIRPHEAINQRCPGDLYTPSRRVWDGKLRSPEYPSNYKVGKVRSCGKMSWLGGEVYLGRVFEGEPIGICEAEKGLIVYYGPIELGILKGSTLEFERRPSRKIGGQPPNPRKTPQTTNSLI